MKKHLFFLFILFNILGVSGNQTFIVTYTFDGTYAASIIEGAEAVTAEDAVAGGTGLLSTKFEPTGTPTFWTGEIRANVTTFVPTFVRMNIAPKESYRLVVDSIVPRQKMNNTGGAFNFRVGCTLSGTTPLENVSASVVQAFTANFSEYVYKPAAEHATIQGMDYVSAWLTARCLIANPSLWSIDEVRIYGTYEKTDEATNTIKVSKNKKQKIRLGVDLAALWYFHSHIKDELAQLAVGEMKSEFVRIVLASAYQLEKNVFNESGYEKELEAMEAMKNANPDIVYFGSPGALHAEYSEEEKIRLFGHVDNTPWTPFPLWVQEWNDSGRTHTMEDGTIVPLFEKGAFHIEELLKLFADHLNFVYTKGFEISYLDLSNEQTIITPAITKYVYDNLPAKLNSGVKMPKIIVPSTWNVQGGIDWLNEVDKSKDEHLAFDIAAIHNTGAGGSLDEFGTAALAMGKEAWNTEMHDWIGIELHDEIINSDILWQHMRAGFTGIDTWLFFGSAGGRPHSMINSAWNAKPNEIKKTGKYEIFKKLVNNANGGNYVDVSMPYSSVITSAFVKDSILTVWVLNKNTKSMLATAFEFEDWPVNDKTIELTKWHKSLPIAGSTTSFLNSSGSGFTYDIDGESLYFFKINIGKFTFGDKNTLYDGNQLNVFQKNGSNQILIEFENLLSSNIDGKYSLFNAYGQLVNSGILTGAETTVEVLSQGFYVVVVDDNNLLSKKKILVR